MVEVFLQLIRFKKYRYILLISTFLLTLLSGCVTKSLWQKNYEEAFYNFLISIDGRQIVFLGDDYHYIFTDNSGLIKMLLNWQKRSLLFIDTQSTYLTVDRKNIVRGEAYIETFPTKFLKEDLVFLRSLGFVPYKKNHTLHLKLKLEGKRYLPRKDLGELPSLDRHYVIKIYSAKSFGGGFVAATLTPIAVTIDAALLIGGVLLIPFKGS